MKNIREICNAIADNLGILHPTCNPLDTNSLWSDMLEYKLFDKALKEIEEWKK